jgi:hypothetical protein
VGEVAAGTDGVDVRVVAVLAAAAGLSGTLVVSEVLPTTPSTVGTAAATNPVAMMMSRFMSSFLS